VRFGARVVPRAEVDRITGVVAGDLAVRVTAAPVDEAANRAVERLIATALGVPRSRVIVAAGARGRLKTIEVVGLPAAALTGRWPGLTIRRSGRA
jgi:uncharacterized protein YggU (UPF0235/DUF167 family)